MALISSGVEKVTAFELPGGIWEDGQCVAAPRIALVKWRSCYSDMLHQVYVNDRFAGATVDAQQRQMVVQMPSSFQSPVRIEVFAVAVEQAHIDFSDQADFCGGDTGRARILMLRSQNLPIGATAQVYHDNGTGEIDYDKPLNHWPLKVWPAWQDKSGFAMSRFGESDFGYDSAAAVGFGKGSFAHGEFGLDADVLEWMSMPLAAGVYKFAVQVTDERGNESSGSETDQVTVVPAAKPAEGLSVLSFNAQTNELVLGVR